MGVAHGMIVGVAHGRDCGCGIWTAEGVEWEGEAVNSRVSHDDLFVD